MNMNRAQATPPYAKLLTPSADDLDTRGVVRKTELASVNGTRQTPPGHGPARAVIRRNGFVRQWFVQCLFSL